MGQTLIIPQMGEKDLKLPTVFGKINDFSQMSKMIINYPWLEKIFISLKWVKMMINYLQCLEKNTYLPQMGKMVINYLLCLEKKLLFSNG